MNDEYAFPPTQEIVNAFPGRRYESREWWPGMELRDFFAAHAQQDALPTFNSVDDLEAYMGSTMPRDTLGAVLWGMAAGAKMRYAYADAMMKERSKVE